MKKLIIIAILTMVSFNASADSKREIVAKTMGIITWLAGVSVDDDTNVITQTNKNIHMFKKTGCDEFNVIKLGADTDMAIMITKQLLVKNNEFVDYVSGTVAPDYGTHAMNLMNAYNQHILPMIEHFMSQTSDLKKIYAVCK